MQNGVWLIAGGFLSYCAYSDLRCGMISVKSCLLAAGAGMAAGMMAGGSAAWAACARGLIPGLIVMGLAIGSGEEIGKGDAWIVMALGALVGAGRCISLFLTALLVSFPFGAVWRLSRRYLHRRGCLSRGQQEQRWQERHQQERWIPFAPSLLLAYVLLSLVRWGV
ncbi:MAG: hypothetical protein NC254_02950 [bacterium]|nr:hypothetical protein [bacterium]